MDRNDDKNGVYLTYFHLSSLLKSWAAYEFPPSLSFATAPAAFQVENPIIPLSLSTVLRQVVFGLPLFLLPSGVHLSAKNGV